MRTLSKLVPLAMFVTAVGVVQACGSVKNDDTDYAQGGRRYPVAGVIRGSVIYQGPRPCSENGHIVGNAILFVFDRRNPPPPSGVANLPSNFTAVPGDVLFANEPRTPGPARYCPKDSGNTDIVTVTAPYAISPMDAGSYYIQAFFDYYGDFLPTFKFRNLPVAGDIGGGAIDINDPNKLIDDPTKGGLTLADGGVIHPQIPKAFDLNYLPVFVPVDVGVPGEVPTDSKRGVPTFTMPDVGFITDNVTVSIGAPLQFSRPYFYPDGADQPARDGTTADPDRFKVPVVTMAQDTQVLAQPTNPQDRFTESLVNAFEASFPHVTLKYGLPPSELPDGINPANPFRLQIAPPPAGGIYVWWNGTHASQGGDVSDDFVPEGQIPRLWPLVAFIKLADDPTNQDPQELNLQGYDRKKPIVLIQGITIGNVGGKESLFGLVANQGVLSREPTPKTLQDHVTAIVRPSVLCLDPRHVDRGGTLVTPHISGYLPKGSHGDDGKPTHPLVSADVLTQSKQLQPLLSASNPFKIGCLPTGRYGINVVYPTGQAWTTPNEMGTCSTKEGANSFPEDPNDPLRIAAPGTCSTQARPVLYSQGPRAVIEIVEPPADTQAGGCGSNPVPVECEQLIGD